jgi:hypothetical protein
LQILAISLDMAAVCASFQRRLARRSDAPDSFTASELRQAGRMRFSVYQVSRRGGRDKNEDRMGYSYTRESGLFALADGMGGHPEGEVASQLALQTLSAHFQREAKPRLAVLGALR